MGRFISADGEMSGLGETVQGYNLYAYCMNNPVNMIDFSGCWPTWGQVIAGAITVAVAAVVVTAVVASAGTVGLAAGAIVAGIGASSSVISAAMTVGTIGTYAVAVGIGACAFSNAGEIVSGKNFIRDNLMGGNQVAYDNLQMGLNTVGGGIVEYANMNTPINSVKGKQTQGTGSHKNNVNPNGSYTKLDNSGKVYSYTEFDGLGRQILKIDYQGRPHNGVLPHIHIYSYMERGGRIEDVFDIYNNKIN